MKSPRQRARNAKASGRRAARIEAPAPRYFSADGTGLPGVSEVLSILSDKERKQSLGMVVEMNTYIKPIYFTRAAITGTVVHTAIEAYMRGAPVDAAVVEAMSRKALHDANRKGEMDPVEVDVQARKARWAYENWVRWAAEQTLEPFAIEERIVDEELGLGMCADLVEHSGNDLYVTDWKTSAAETVGHLKAGLVVKYRMQLGAYAGLVGRKHGQRVAGARLVFAPKHEGRDVYVIEMNREELAEQWHGFEHALALYKLLNKEES